MNRSNFGKELSINPAKMVKPKSLPKTDETGAPPLPRYNARAMRPGGMAKGGAVKCDGIASRGRTRGKIV